MKVLLVHCHYQIRGGEDTIFASERDMLRAAGVEVVCFEKSNADFSRSGGRLSLFLRTVWNRAVYREMLETLARERPDVVHCHNTFPAMSPAVYWASAKARVPVVQTLHNFRTACLDGYFFREQSCRICMRCLGRAPLAGVFRRCYRGSLAASATVAAMLMAHRVIGTWRRKVARYIALSDFGREKFIEAGLPAEKVVVKRNVVLCDDIVPAADLDRPADEGSFQTFMYIGRLSREKGVSTLVEAWNRAALPDARLEILGDGPLRAELEALAGGNGSIAFRGGCSHKEAMERLREANALVLTSRWYESFATTPLEAMSLGVPSILSDTAAKTSLVQPGRHGLVFPAGDVDALAAVLRDAHADPRRMRALGAAGREAFLASECPPERNVRRLLDIYSAATTVGSG